MLRQLDNETENDNVFDGEATVITDKTIAKQARALYRSIYRKLYFKKYYETHRDSLQKASLENYHTRHKNINDNDKSKGSKIPEAIGSKIQPNLNTVMKPLRIERRPITINLNLNSFYIDKKDDG